MKKIFLALSTLLMILCAVGIANSSTIGNDVTDRIGTSEVTLDTATNFTMIDTNLVFTENGFIDEWSFWARPADNSVGTIYLQTFEHLSGNDYRLTGQNIITTASIGLNTFAIPVVDQIQANIGEFIGWTTSEGTIPFTGNNDPGSVIFDLANVMTVGETFTADSNYTTGLNRVYSISANVSTVPEPATMLLFGIGLLGLAGMNRRKK